MMIIKNFLMVCIFFALTFINQGDSRELSIQQLEERKKADLERAEKRKKRGKNLFQKKLHLQQKSHLYQWKEKHHQFYQILIQF